MNPLTAHLERYQKQPPLIKDDDDGAGVRKRPFSNCVLFVLLAVFVFFLLYLVKNVLVLMFINDIYEDSMSTRQLSVWHFRAGDVVTA